MRGQVTTLNMLRVVSVMLTAVAMAGGFAHLLELPNKSGLSREDYLKVQQIYRGWALLGFAVTRRPSSTSQWPPLCALRSA